MVKALHRAGLEVILDVVYNHTAEGDEEGPTLCFRGLENAAYYILEPDRARYCDYTGTGNTLNANHPVVRRLIVDSLRYWVAEMHVDGFRFDLASILSRDECGRPLANPPVLWDIESDPHLAGTKLIAEAWDAGGLYQVGSFVGDAWREWNGKFRDDVRRFLRGDDGLVSVLATRLLASPDLYAHKEREPEESINFVTCHDGFTLNDLVSYNDKHNAANGEQNRDGCRRQLQLELRDGRPDRRPGDRADPHAPGQEFSGPQPAGDWHADAVGRRRSAADATRQQQRLLPGQRNQLVRLVVGGKARGVAAVRETPLGLPPRSPSRLRGLGCHVDRIPRQRLSAMARGRARQSRLGAPFPQLGSHSKSAASGSDPALDSECLLGAAQLRASARARGLPRSVAAMDRHRS